MHIFVGIIAACFLLAAISPHPKPREKSEGEKFFIDIVQLSLGAVFALIALGVWE
jgi:hypothetical protein